MPRRRRSNSTTPLPQTVHRRLAALEAELTDNSRRVTQLENTLRAVMRETENVSVGGPCVCGECLLLVQRRRLYCPKCNYQQTM
ncbi:hypothetical protein GS429_04110 [Natronorubrum sp. JWXQ-INN-674]|uniref:Uncharacterized protein n=1 Tax=Natronorubrum halalkaliphilum TaxID=2691917 RepID=A0A6B0VL19_9EURY|nr:hypothetical protein [Natronorubrum halalkaliphilum]MXV61259.1 hypothetical protein [Natronorubrum halalkaliphilum]